MKKVFLLPIALLFCWPGSAQSLKKPDVPAPSLKLVKPPRYYASVPGSMGLFDWNFSGGYIDKIAKLSPSSATSPDVATSGQYLMFHLQESLLSNYMLAKRSRRDKKFKIGFQNTVDLGIRRGTAVTDASDYTQPPATDAGTVKMFLNYQAGIACAFRVARGFDLGFTYYPYVKSVFNPDTRKYLKARLRAGRLMAEYSFSGLDAIELKYVKSRKVYFGFGYVNYKHSYNGTFGQPSSDVSTNWFHLSIGQVF